MSDEIIQAAPGFLQAAHQSGRKSAIDPAGTTYESVTWPDSNATRGTGGFISLEVLAACATQDAKAKVQYRNHAGDDWVDAASEVTLTAGASMVSVFSGNIRGAQWQLVVGDSLTAGAIIEASYTLK